VTWMDVCVNGILPTPRHGKPVEINAYWYNALRIMDALASDLELDRADYRKLAETVRNSFREQFYRKDKGYLKDVISQNETWDKINSVFNRFDRIDRNLSRHKEGSGIGLNIVKQMVEHLNGTIDIDSIENEGTTVTIGLKKVLDENIEKYTYYNDILQKVELELSDI